MKITVNLTALEVSECAVCFGIHAYLTRIFHENMMYAGTPNLNDSKVIDESILNESLYILLDYLFNHDLELMTFDKIVLKNGKVLLNQMCDLVEIFDGFPKKTDEFLTNYGESARKTVQPSIDWFAQFVDYGEVSFEMNEIID